MARKRRPLSEPNPIGEYLLEYENTADIAEERTCRQRWRRYCIIIGIIILVLTVLAFIAIFVILPVIFMHSIGMQRHLMFTTWNTRETQHFGNFRKYGIEGARNFYVPATFNQTVQLGVWHVLPLAYVYEAVENYNFNYEASLRNSPYPVVLYFHGTGSNRITNNKMYRVLRRFFHVVVFDYRGYGDSSEAELSEASVVQDAVQMYKWLRSQTKAKIYIWGYSLGTAISTHAVKRLRKEGIVPTGLFLESPFTSIREELEYSPPTKLFRWLPWFEATITDPLEGNGFHFKTIENILSVDCPILIVHAEDDPIVPYFLGEKLSQVARDMRDAGIQGNVTFHSFPAQFGFGHTGIYEAVELPDYIRTHIGVCKAYDNGKG